ncbi:MAG: hypothetical protein MRK02_06475 [Candidatus Scalindua sp.]|nr:hypothetical protein [Candidatus Scalindua sp.]
MDIFDSKARKKYGSVEKCSSSFFRLGGVTRREHFNAEGLPDLTTFTCKLKNPD